MKRIIVDVETDGLQWTKCWVVVTRDLDTDEVKTFRSIHNAGLAIEQLRNYLAGCELIIGHNIISFALDVLKRGESCGVILKVVIMLSARISVK